MTRGFFKSFGDDSRKRERKWFLAHTKEREIFLNKGISVLLFGKFLMVLKLCL